LSDRFIPKEIHICVSILNNESLDFVNIEQQEAGWFLSASISKILILPAWPRHRREAAHDWRRKRAKRPAVQDHPERF